MRKLILAISIVTMLGCASVKPAEPTPTVVQASSWCDKWNTFGDVEGEAPVTSRQRFMFHLGFFLSKSDRVAKALKQDHPMFDENTINNIVTCYEENTPVLVDQLDKVCKQGTPNQDKQVTDSMLTYIRWCIDQNTTKA